MFIISQMNYKNKQTKMYQNQIAFQSMLDHPSVCILFRSYDLDPMTLTYMF